MADKLRTTQNLEALQAKHVGTGHADTTKKEWFDNIVRDTAHSFIGHQPLLELTALGMGLHPEEVRMEQYEHLIRGWVPSETAEVNVGQEELDYLMAVEMQKQQEALASANATTTDDIANGATK
ncbi:hypothetical protein N7532_010567 [Penicillium argentinense]|uniref:Uncharacterized protein n=1 Tax=Penicillium argentinense TaxID=1131581 RepID=A0A9W9EQ49_9EURO|nr:uncharacterized protein N7532_010567 [Penicillium argentinense]KAJ5085796.1 hypothetical protein N7532_010567 [Penicillium argentinense]